MQNIVINTRYGGFSLSEQARSILGITEEEELGLDRCDPRLVQVVRDLGEAANGDHAHLKIVEVPDLVKFEIIEFDGAEYVAECHRKWY